MGLRVALGQATTSEEKKENLAKGLDLIRLASEKKSDLLVLPELFMAYVPLSAPRRKFYSVAEALDGPFVKTLANEAKRRSLHVAVGLLEKGDGKGRMHNTVVLIGPDGSVLAKHRKVQLFDSFGYKESRIITPGSEFEGSFKTSLGRLGLMTCYELRFPELARILSLQGADVIVVPTAWVAGSLKEEHLRTFARARALENTVFVVVACQTGRIFTGRSTVIDPFGVPMCDGGEEEGLVLCEIDLARIKRVRAILPSLGHLRRDIYARFLAGDGDTASRRR